MNFCTQSSAQFITNDEWRRLLTYWVLTLNTHQRRRLTSNRNCNIYICGQEKKGQLEVKDHPALIQCLKRWWEPESRLTGHTITRSGYFEGQKIWGGAKWEYWFLLHWFFRPDWRQRGLHTGALHFLSAQMGSEERPTAGKNTTQPRLLLSFLLQTSPRPWPSQNYLWRGIAVEIDRENGEQNKFVLKLRDAFLCFWCVSFFRLFLITRRTRSTPAAK